jgi:hypothetical protein
MHMWNTKIDLFPITQNLGIYHLKSYILNMQLGDAYIKTLQFISRITVLTGNAHLSRAAE